MKPEHWQKIEPLFHEALQSDEKQRQTLIHKTRKKDPETAKQLEDLLHSHFSSGGTFLEQDFMEFDFSVEGTTVGPWKIISEIGRGGTSRVYLAERHDGSFTRKVAIKFLNGVVPGKEMTSRIRTEQQILAQLQHPNICNLLDAGIHHDGRPYFIMEYIEGLNIDAWCKQNNLTLQQQISLFRQVCEAVTYAHQQLIIHRDLKPSNILVNTDGNVKLLDFGIAKMLDESSESDPHKTVTGYFMMTPEYASPEQITGARVSTSADVYALGLILYQILTGRHPFSFENSNPLEIGEIITKKSPSRPSTVIRQTRPALARQIEGDLDVIIMKALRKEPERRYRSAEQLLSDIHNYQHNLPVTARPESKIYRAQKFITRHTFGFTASVLFLAGIISAAIFSFWQAEQAKIEAQKAQAVSGFLVEMFSAADPREQGPDVKVATLMDDAVLRLEESFQNQPDVEASLRHTFGITFRELGLFSESLEQLERAVDLKKNIYEQGHISLLQSQNEAGATLVALGNYSQADSVLTLAFETAKHSKHANDTIVADIASSLGHVLYYTGNLQGSRDMHQTSVDIRFSQEEPDSVEIGSALGNVAIVLADLGEFEESLNRLKQQENIYRNNLNPNNTRLARVLVNIASVYRDLAMADSALISNQEAIEIFEHIVGRDHPEFAWALGDLGNTYARLNLLDESEQTLLASLNIYKEAFGETHPRTAVAHIRLGQIYSRNNKSAMAINELEEALRIALLNSYSEDSRLIMDIRTYLSEISPDSD